MTTNQSKAKSQSKPNTSESSDIILELKAWTSKVLEGLAHQLEEREAKQDELLEAYEKQLAALVQGYAEMAAMIEALISFVVNRSPDEVDEFFVHLGEARKTMLTTLGHASENAQRNADRFTAHSTEPSMGSAGTPDSEQG